MLLEKPTFGQVDAAWWRGSPLIQSVLRAPSRPKPKRLQPRATGSSMQRSLGELLSSPWAAADAAPPPPQPEHSALWHFVESTHALQERLLEAIQHEEAEEQRQLKVMYASGTERLVKAGEVLLGVVGAPLMDAMQAQERIVEGFKYLWEFEVPDSRQYISHRTADEQNASAERGQFDAPGQPQGPRLARSIESLLLRQVAVGDSAAFGRFRKGEGVMITGGFVSKLASNLLSPGAEEPPVTVGTVYEVPRGHPAIQIAVSSGVHRQLTQLLEQGEEGEAPVLWRIDKYEMNVTARRQRRAIEEHMTPVHSMNAASGTGTESPMQLDFALDASLKRDSVLEEQLDFLAPQNKVLYALAGQRYSREVALSANAWARREGWRKLMGRLLEKAREEEGLNPSQAAAISAAVFSTLTLWQGPPGTGKTKTLLCLLGLLCAARDEGAGAQGSFTHAPLLACAETNTATDNLVEGLHARGINAVRLGNRYKVRESALHRTLEELVTADPAYSEVEAKKVRAEALQRMAHRKIALARQRADPQIYTALAAKLQQEQQARQRRRQGAAPQLLRQDARGGVGPAERKLISQALLLEARQLLDEAEELAEGIGQRLLSNCQVICATTSGTGAWFTLEDREFPVVVIDEATQATEPSVLVPILMRKPELVVLAGDPCQLPPTVLSAGAKELQLDVSLFERIEQTDEPGEPEPEESPSGLSPLLLNTQYRMHPRIAEFPAATFYGDRLLTDDSTWARTLPAGFPWPNPQCPVALLDVVEGQETTGRDGASYTDVARSVPLHSKRNAIEAQYVSRALAMLLQGEEDCNVAILTPYTAQAAVIQADLQRRGLLHRVEVNTVDGYQGREADVIIFSTVRSRNQLGFVADRRRLNVAITRPKRGLIVVGKAKTLSQGEELRAWVEWAGAQGCILTTAALREAHAKQASDRPGRQRSRRR